MDIEQREFRVQKYVLVLSEEEVATAIDDPTALVRELKRVAGEMVATKRAIRATAEKIVKARQERKASSRKKNSGGVKADKPAGKFRCKKCGRTFNAQGWLRQHEARVHTDVEIGTYDGNGDD
jgi:tRNA(Ile2) C34 agmatinyltransferase TiaS